MPACPRAAHGQLSPGPRIRDSPRAPGGVDTSLPLNVTSPPPSGRGMTGKRTDFLNATPLPLMLMKRPGSRRNLSGGAISIDTGCLLQSVRRARAP